MNIIFGTKRLGKVDGSHESYQKYVDKAVVTLEADRGKGRTRRILFNKKSMELLNLENGFSQYIVFGTLEADNSGERAILIANADNLSNIEDLTTYRTSKNAVAYDDSKEKGKAISSSKLTKDMITFLDLDEEKGVEYALEPFDADGLSDTYRFVSLIEKSVNELVSDVELNEDESILKETEAEPVVE